MCSKHVEAWNKLIVKQQFCVSSWLITEINISRNFGLELGCVYTCLTQLYDGRYMYNLLHKDQLHVSALFIGHLQVDNLKLKPFIKQLY